MSSTKKYKCTLELVSTPNTGVIGCSIKFSPNLKTREDENNPFVHLLGLQLLRAAYLMASEPEFGEGLKALLERFPDPEETEDKEAGA